MEPGGLARPEAMAIAGGRILAVGSRAELESFVGPGTKMLDHGSGTIMPGFVEPHLHLVTSALVFDGGLLAVCQQEPG